MKRWFSVVGVIGIVLGIVFLFTDQLFAQTSEVIELKVSHFGSPEWLVQKEVLEPWAKKVEELSGGRVKFTFYPSQQLGSAKEQYDLAVKGIADIAASVLGYTPERFPKSSVMDLPFLGESGERASLVFWSVYKKYLEDEFKDVKVLALFCHGPGHLHTVNKQIKTLEDLKGLKIRAGNPTVAKILEKLGAEPVICPVTEAQEKIKKGEIEGVCLPWEGFYAFKFFDCKYHTEANLYTMGFFIVMNKQKYESLPQDIRKIIDETTGEVMSVTAGRAMDEYDLKGKRYAEENGHIIYTLPKAELERWKKLTLPIGDIWIEEMKVKDIPGEEILRYVTDLFTHLQQR